MFGLSGEFILIIIFVVIILAMAVALIKFLNQSIDIAIQLEKEMEYSKKIFEENRVLKEDMKVLVDEVEQYQLYSSKQEMGTPSHEYGESTQSTGDYGAVEVYQHYEALEAPVTEKVVEEVKEEEEVPQEEVKEKKKKKKKGPVVAKAKVVEVPISKKEEDKAAFMIQDVFLIYKDGRLVTHLSKKVRIIDDSEIIGSMITAVQMFVRESFKREAKGGVLNEMKFGEMIILMEHGELLNLAAVIIGRHSKDLKRAMKKVLGTLHNLWPKETEAWDGKLTQTSTLDRIIERDLLERFESETFHKDESKALDLSKAGIFSPK